jgi:hypothetical protein
MKTDAQKIAEGGRVIELVDVRFSRLVDAFLGCESIVGIEVGAVDCSEGFCLAIVFDDLAQFMRATLELLSVAMTDAELADALSRIGKGKGGTRADGKPVVSFPAVRVQYADKSKMH